MSENRLSEESWPSEQSGMLDMRIIGLHSELHMKQSLLDRMRSQLTESKNLYHELSCQVARRSSPGASPSYDFYYGMYEKLKIEHDELRHAKKEIDDMYSETRAEIIDNQNLIKTHQISHDDLGRKYDDAFLKIDKMSTNPNLSGKALDKLHNEIIDREEVANRLPCEVDAQREEIDRIGNDAGRAVRR